MAPRRAAPCCSNAGTGWHGFGTALARLWHLRPQVQGQNLCSSPQSLRRGRRTAEVCSGLAACLHQGTVRRGPLRCNESLWGEYRVNLNGFSPLTQTYHPVISSSALSARGLWSERLALEVLSAGAANICCRGSPRPAEPVWDDACALSPARLARLCPSPCAVGASAFSLICGVVQFGAPFVGTVSPVQDGGVPAWWWCQTSPPRAPHPWWRCWVLR